MRLKGLLSVALIAAALGIASCGGGGSDSTSSASTETEAAATTPNPADESAPSGTPASGKLERSVKVDIANFEYNPDPVQVAVGGKVIWMNEDSAPHTATADDGSFDTGTIEEGKIKSETFKQPGTYTYFCEIHPTMHGTIEVIEPE